MPSKLFQVATTRERREARNVFAQAPMRRLTRDIHRIKRASGGQAVKQLYRQIATPAVQQMMRELESQLGRGGVVRYSGNAEQRQALDRLLGVLGPVGNAIRSVVTPGKGSFTRDSFNAAVDLIRAFGGEVLVGKGRPGYDRGLEAARKILEDAGYTVIPPGQGGVPETEPAGLEHRPHLTADLEPTTWISEREIRVASSSVYSYSFEQETDTAGTLYVTFLEWTPGMQGKGTGPGATYAYYDVSLSKYQAFRRAASRSAGEAVWDYLRVRGSAHEHQQPYELVSGVLIQPRGVYIPRKATEVGYMRRAIQVQGGRRGQWLRSALPSREYLPARGEPNRGEPNRGR